jgi:hypothetical protein
VGSEEIFLRERAFAFIYLPEKRKWRFFYITCGMQKQCKPSVFDGESRSACLYIPEVKARVRAGV